MIVFPDGSQVGTLGGGCVEAEVKRRALQLLEHQIADLASLEHASPQNALQDALAHLANAHYGQFHGPKSSSKPAAATGDEKPPFRVGIPTVKIAHPTWFIAVFTVNPTACP